MTEKPETPSSPGTRGKDQLPTPEDHSLELLLQRTPDTEQEGWMWPAFAAGEEKTDDEFWGFADTFKQIPRLHRGEDGDRAGELRPASTAPTPPRLVIPPAFRGWSSEDLTPLPRGWPPGDVALAVLVALTTFGLTVLLLVK